MSTGEPLTTQQKITVAFVIVIGLTTMVFGAVHMHRSIYDPFKKDPTLTYKSQEELAAERDAELKTKDTDGDGLSDYDELYVFRTSPFLADSDSDGFDDGVEVANANDPNCPAGKTCRQPSLSGGGGSGSTSTSAAGAGATGVSAEPGVTQDQAKVLSAMDKLFGDIKDPTPEAISQRIMSLPGQDLRDFLKTMGIPQEALDKADDATLKAMLADTIAGTSDDPKVQAAMDGANTADSGTSGDTETSADAGADATTPAGTADESAG